MKKTPHYGGTNDIDVISDKSIKKNDSCNTKKIMMSSHSGTHIDAPYHFLNNGMKIEEYPPETWIYKHIAFIPLDQINPGAMITPQYFKELDKYSQDTELILIKTSFEKFRNTNTYWDSGPGFHQDLATHFLNTFPNLRAFGIDCISISSLMHRSMGRLAHKSFLSQNLLIIEDMMLSTINQNDNFKQVIITPLRFLDGDGAPCTAIALIDDV